MDKRTFKDRLYSLLADVAKALASPKRVELVELLCQAERTVEWLAAATQMSVANTSQHLQALRRAHVVDARRDGAYVRYRVVDLTVVQLLLDLRRVAEARDAELERLVRDYFGDRHDLEAVGMGELLDRAARGEVVVVDVRPREEFAAGHVPGAVSAPLDELDELARSLPKRKVVVAYCRGPYCVLADEAVRRLRERGRRAARLDGGFPEWRVAGLPVEVSA